MTPQPVGAGEAIDVRARRASVDERGLRTEVDIRVPGTAFGRQVYFPTREAWRVQRPHRHDSPHHLVCMAGSCVVAVQRERSGPVERHVLGPGEVFPVPSGVAHQVLVAPGGVMASYVPHNDWILPAPVEHLDGDWVGGECG